MTSALSRESGFAALLPDDACVAEEVLPARWHRQHELAAGDRCADRALADLGIPGAVQRTRGGAPRWPAQVVGSITHGAGTCAVAVAHRDTVPGIGIDVAPHAPLSERVARRVLGGRSRRPLSRDSVVLSAKESLFKAWSPLTGTFLRFAEARVDVRDDGSLGIVVVRDDGAGEPWTWKGGYVVTAGVVRTVVVAVPR